MERLAERPTESVGFRRRAVAAWFGALAAALTTLAVSPATAMAEEAMLYTRSGYDMDGMHGAYVGKHGVKPEFTFFPDEDAAFAKVRAGFTPDVSTICSYEISRWRDADLLQPIDESRLGNFPELIGSLKKVPDSVVDGERWWVPLDWGKTSVTYRTDMVDMEEESWGLLWDPRYEGRLGMWDDVVDGMAIAPIYMGIDPYRMTPDQVAEVRDLLIEQRPLLRFYSSDRPGIERALAAGELVAAVTATDSYVKLKSEGVPVAFLNPKEGVMTWSCGLVLMKDAPNVDKAYDLIDGMIGEEAGATEMRTFGFGHANAMAFQILEDGELEAIGLPRDPETLLNGGVLQRAFENREELVEMYEEVKSGF